MISLYSGTPGSGKSLHVAENIWMRLRRSKRVIANFDVNTKKIHKTKELDFIYLPNDQMKPSLLVTLANAYWEKKQSRVKEDEILLVIDEAQILFNSREWQSGGRSQWLTFFTQHRKMGYEIILVAQFDGMIDRQIRSLIEYEYIHRKVKNFGIYGLIFNLLAFGGLFCYVEMWYPLNERITAHFFKADKDYFAIYDTYNIFNADFGFALEDKDKKNGKK